MDFYFYKVFNLILQSASTRKIYLHKKFDSFCSIGHLNTQDEYLYFDGYDNINSMDENAFQRMLTKSADDLINLFALDHEISLFE